MIRAPFASLAALGLVALTACGTLSVQDEKRLGHEAQRQIRSEYQMMRDRVVVNYVRELVGSEKAPRCRAVLGRGGRAPP